MPELRRENTRVIGRSIGRMTGPSKPDSVKGMTPEQKADRLRETFASYERWRAAREARLQNKRL